MTNRTHQCLQNLVLRLRVDLPKGALEINRSSNSLLCNMIRNTLSAENLRIVSPLLLILFSLSGALLY